METLTRLPLRIRIVVVSCLLLVATLLIDHLFFSYWFLSFPNESEWGESPWYNFSHKINQLERTANETQNRILVLGSSVALFSILPEKLNSNPEKTGNIELFSHVAMAPTDAFYYLPRIASTKPKQVYYFLNFGDLQWEHTKIVENKIEFDEESWVFDFASRNPARVFYPWSFLNDYYSRLGKKAIFTLLSKSLLNVNRVRNFFLHPFESWLENHFRGGHSFSQFQGSLPLGGIWSRGWVFPEDKMECYTTSFERNAIFIPKKESVIRLTLEEKIGDRQRAVIDLKFENSGWQKIKDHPGFQEKGQYFLSKPQEILVQWELLTPSISSKDLEFAQNGKSYPVGFRLSQGFCLDHPNYRNSSYVRRRYFEDSRLEKMSDSEYESDYFDRFEFEKEKRPALQRLNLINQRKKEVNAFDFETFSEIERVIAVVRELEMQGIDTVLVLSPDNPIEAKLYSEGKWFKGFKIHLKKEIEKSGGELIDWTNAITEEQLFLDPHHLTYGGAEKLSQKLYLELSENKVRKKEDYANPK